MKIDNLTIKNFRCFETENIKFTMPDGINNGSGLNIFIGENGNGKTSVLEAICYLTQSRLKTKNTLTIKDFLHINKKIEISGETNEFETDHVYGKSKFKCKGFSFEAKTRNESHSTNLLDPLVFDNKVIPSDVTSVKDYELRIDVMKPWGTSRLPDFNIVFFDKNRTRHISKSLFPAKFDDLIDDLNFQILEKINSLDSAVKEEKDVKNKILGVNEYVRKILFSVLSDKFLGDVIKDCKGFFEEDIKLDIINNLEPFLYSFFSARKINNNQQLPLSRLGSGIEMIFSIIFLYHFYIKRKTNIIFLIDEPELHLHPIWQSKLINLLMEISKNTQVFISTHSPFIFKNCLKSKAGLLIYGKDKNNKITITDARKNKWGHFPWSPSWGEINYYAYNLPTIEFHNELYGFLQDKENKYIENDFEEFLVSKGITQNKTWIRMNNNGTTNSYSVSLSTYIRNKIHHPENTHNMDFSDQELRDSMETMIKLI
ncbi:MAG: AAA family ATPase [Patescibacteria group bacterium]